MSRSDFCKAIPAVGLGSHFCNSAITFVLPAFRSNSKSDKFEAQEKGTSAPTHTNILASSHANAPALAESTLALKYSKMDLIRILKIFLETKGQEPKAEVPCKQPLKAKVPNVYFGNLHINCYHFSQQYEDYFEIAGAIGSNHIPFAALFFCGKINFWLH